MNKRKLLRITLLTLMGLFLVFSMVNVNYSITIWLTLFWSLILISLFELIAFYIRKRQYRILGGLEESKTRLKDILVFITIFGIAYVSVKYSYLIDLKSNQFLSFFFGERRSIVSEIFLLPLLKTLIVDNTFFYITDKGVTTKGNYFEDYLWEDFKDYSLIEEQSLIRFRKKNDNFLFVKYEESYFQENKIEITKVLNKNIAYV